MIIENEPYLIEYNVRMGDPECQTILPKLKTDIIDIFNTCCEKNCMKLKFNGQTKKLMCSFVFEWVSRFI